VTTADLCHGSNPVSTISSYLYPLGESISEINGEVLFCRFAHPILWQQVGEFVVGMIGDAGENVFEIGERFNFVSFGSGNERVDNRGALGAFPEYGVFDM